MMSMKQRMPTLVDVDELPEYPIPSGERLESHFYIELHFNRWLNSELRLLAEPDVRAYAIDLFCICQNQAPVGSLPINPRIQAKLLGLDLSVWESLLKRECTPLYKWDQYRCDNGDIVLGHPVVIEMAQKAFGSRMQKLADLAAGRERKRLKDLTERVAQIGTVKMAADPHFMGLVRRWLEENCKGSWTMARVQSAVEAVSISKQ